MNSKQTAPGIPNQNSIQTLDKIGEAGRMLSNSIDRIRADFQTVQTLFLIYPEGVIEGQKETLADYSGLAPFYDELIGLVPEEIKVVVLVKKASFISKVQGLRSNVQCVVNADLASIWLRDFAGFNMGNALVKPRFRPDYHYVKDSEKIEQSVRSLHSLLGVDLIDLPIIWDGGNLVTNGEVGFITDRIVRNNNGKKDQILNQIREVLGINPVIVPAHPQDLTAHTDGYIAFLDSKTIAISQYSGSWYNKHPKDRPYLDELAKVAREYDLEVVRLLENPTTDKPHNFDSARGSYINFLRLNDVIIMPSYSGNDYDPEIEAAAEAVLSRYGKVVKINCNDLSDYGGVLHCISFTW